MKKITSFLIILVSSLILLSCGKEDINPDGTSSNFGTISFVNNSDNPYNVFINDDYAFQMNGKTYRDRQVESGYYYIRVEQVSGYVFYPTVLNYSANVGKGQKVVVSFP